MSDDILKKSNTDETQPEDTPNNTEEALLDTDSPELIIRYNLFHTGEEVGPIFLPTGHANITLIKRDFLKAGGVFDDDQIDAYIDLKMEEVHRVAMHPNPVEFDLYYKC